MQSSSRVKLIAAVCAGVLLIASVPSYVLYRYLSEGLLTDAEREVEEFSNIWQDQLDLKLNDILMAIEVLVVDEEVPRRFAALDRDGLAARLGPVFENVLKPAHDITQFHFHLPPAISFLRLHRPEQFGDDLSEWRRSLVRANAERRTVRGIEVTRSGPGLKVVRPVAYEGRHIGTVELATSISRLLEDISRSVGAAYAIGIRRDVWESARCEDLLAAEVVKHGDLYYEFSSPSVKRILAESRLEGATEIVRVQGAQYAVSTFPLLDLTDRRVATIAVVKDITAHAASFRSSVLLSGAIVLALASLMSVPVYLLVTAKDETQRQQSYLADSTATMLREMRKLASGDLTVDLDPEGDDEIAQLFGGFNDVVRNTSEMILGVSELASRTNSAVQEIASVGESLASGAEEQATSSSTITIAVEEMTATMADASEQAGLAAARSSEARESARSGIRESEKARVGMQEVVSASRRSGAHVNALERHLDEVDEVIQFIGQVAKRIHLLSLNATIQAASAGEHGRAFNVVATEIRKLAENTSQAGDKVEATLEELKRDAAAVVSLSRSEQELVDQAQDLVEQFLTRFRDIAGSFDAVTDTVKRVALANDGQAESGGHVMERVREIGRVTQQTSTSALQIARRAQDLAKLSAELEGRMKRFRLRAAAKGNGNGARRRPSSPAAPVERSDATPDRTTPARA